MTASISRTPPPGPVPLAAAQDQVLVEMRGARQGRRIVRGARGHPDLDRDQRARRGSPRSRRERHCRGGARRARAARPSPAARPEPHRRGARSARGGPAAGHQAAARPARGRARHGRTAAESTKPAEPTRRNRGRALRLAGAGVLWPEHETPGVLAGGGGRGRRPRVRARTGRGGARGAEPGLRSAARRADRRRARGSSWAAVAARSSTCPWPAARVARRAGRDGAITLRGDRRRRGRPARLDLVSNVRARDASLLDHRIALDFRAWSRDNYVVLPGAVYAGNRFQARRAAYPPLLTEPADIGPHVPPIIPDIPRLSAGSGPSALSLDAGALAIPALGVRVPAARLGHHLAPATRRRGPRPIALAIAESDDRARATLTIGARGRDEIPVRVHVFDCADIPRPVRAAACASKGASGRDRAGQRAAVLGLVRRSRGARERAAGRRSPACSRSASAPAPTRPGRRAGAAGWRRRSR